MNIKMSKESNAVTYNVTITIEFIWLSVIYNNKWEKGKGT